MARLTAQERLDRTSERTSKAIADAQEALRVAKAAAREESRKAHVKHLWTLARLLDATGLSAYPVEVLAPHFTTLAAHLATTASGQSEASGNGMAALASVSALRAE